MSAAKQRPARTSTNPFEYLRAVMKSPTMIAVGIDPQKGMFHACLRTADHQKRWSEPLSKQAKAIFDLIRSMLT